MRAKGSEYGDGKEGRRSRGSKGTACAHTRRGTHAPRHLSCTHTCASRADISRRSLDSIASTLCSSFSRCRLLSSLHPAFRPLSPGSAFPGTHSAASFAHPKLLLASSPVPISLAFPRPSRIFESRLRPPSSACPLPGTFITSSLTMGVPRIGGTGGRRGCLKRGLRADLSPESASSHSFFTSAWSLDGGLLVDAAPLPAGWIRF